MNKFLLSFCVSIFTLFLAGVLAAASTSGSRMIQAIAGPDQEIKQVKGIPVIVSKKRYYLYLMPESIFSDKKAPIKFTLLLQNPTENPWHFSMGDLKAYTNESGLKILGPDRVVAEARKEFSEEEYKINREQAKALAPYVEEKMRNLTDSLLKTGDIPPGGKIQGVIFIDVPQGTERLTIEVRAAGELHKFILKIIEL